MHRNRGVVRHNARRKAEESSASGTMDGGTVCEEVETKHQIQDEILQEQLERLQKLIFQILF